MEQELLYWLKLCRELQSRVAAMWIMEYVGKWPLVTVLIITEYN